MVQFISSHVTTYIMELTEIKEVTGCVSGPFILTFICIIYFQL